MLDPLEEVEPRTIQERLDEIQLFIDDYDPAFWERESIARVLPVGVR